MGLTFFVDYVVLVLAIGIVVGVLGIIHRGEGLSGIIVVNSWIPHRSSVETTKLIPHTQYHIK